MSDHGQRACGNCGNCGMQIADEYCPRCGQETRALPSVREYLRECFDSVLSLESRILRTLARLLFAPGALTAEYLAGKRVRYVRPARFYLWVSVLVVAMVESSDLRLGLHLGDDLGVYLVQGHGAIETGAEFEPAQGSGTPRAALSANFTAANSLASNATAQTPVVGEHRPPGVRYLLLLLVPLFAGVMHLCYLGRRRAYADFLVFSLHAQSFLLLALLVAAMAPAIVASVISWGSLLYFPLAAQRVFGGPPLATIARCVAAIVVDIGMFMLCGAVFLRVAAAV